MLPSGMSALSAASSEIESGIGSGIGSNSESATPTAADLPAASPTRWGSSAGTGAAPQMRVLSGDETGQVCLWELDDARGAARDRLGLEPIDDRGHATEDTQLGAEDALRGGAQ